MGLEETGDGKLGWIQCQIVTERFCHRRKFRPLEIPTRHSSGISGRGLFYLLACARKAWWLYRVGSRVRFCFTSPSTKELLGIRTFYEVFSTREAHSQNETLGIFLNLTPLDGVHETFRKVFPVIEQALAFSPLHSRWICLAGSTFPCHSSLRLTPLIIEHCCL
jgi:hypothetical protein